MNNNKILTEDGRFIAFPSKKEKAKGSAQNMESRLEAYKAEVAALSEEIAILKSDSWKKSAEQSIENLSMKNASLLRQIETLKNTIGDYKNKTKHNADLHNEVVTLRAKTKDYDAIIEEIVKLREREKECKSLVEENNVLRAQIAELTKPNTK